MKDNLITIGNNIKKYRTIAKISQKQLADKIGVSHFWICKLENGKRNTTINLLILISECLNVELSQLTENSLA
jgi:transcriptional regulator with XRE-family HTH domain